MDDTCYFNIRDEIVRDYYARLESELKAACLDDADLGVSPLLQTERKTYEYRFVRLYGGALPPSGWTIYKTSDPAAKAEALRRGLI